MTTTRMIFVEVFKRIAIWLKRNFIKDYNKKMPIVTYTLLCQKNLWHPLLVLKSIISSQHLYWLTSVKSKNTGFPLVLSLKTENISPASHSIRPPRSNSKPHKPLVSQVHPTFLEQNSFVALFTHSSLAMFIQMRFHVGSGVRRSPILKPKMCCWSKASALEQRHLFWLFFFSMGIQGNISICWPHGSTLVDAGTSVGLSSLPSHTAPSSTFTQLVTTPAARTLFSHSNMCCLMLCNKFQKARLAGSTTGNRAIYWFIGSKNAKCKKVPL